MEGAPDQPVTEAAPDKPVVEPSPGATAPDPAGGSGPPTEEAAGEAAPPSRGLGGADGAAGSPPPPVPPPAPVPAPVAEAEKKDGFDIVPVYYGTDRAEASTEKRLDYGANRGRKLALGQALVTVPKSHVQPTIERPWAIRIPYFDITLYEEAEDPERHFTMKELKAATREEFLAIVRARLAKSERYKDHALVFVHGYNTTFDNGVYRTAQIAYDLKFDGAPFLYSWPSGGGLASYTYDRESAGQAVPYMREFLDLVIKETGAKTVSVIAHSMGNQPTLQVLKDIKASSPPGIVISQIILAAPDVDRDNFENIAKEIQGLANGITLYAAANDRALGASRRFHGGVPRAGDVPEGGPLVLPGVDTIDVTAVSTDSFGLNHSGYAENNALLNDLQLLIQTGERPPEKRVPLLEKIGTSLGDYWRYPVTP
jgi:esterase/lipase superfamily enzyme